MEEPDDGRESVTELHDIASIMGTTHGADGLEPLHPTINSPNQHDRDTHAAQPRLDGPGLADGTLPSSTTLLPPTGASALRGLDAIAQPLTSAKSAEEAVALLRQTRGKAFSLDLLALVCLVHFGASPMGAVRHLAAFDSEQDMVDVLVASGHFHISEQGAVMANTDVDLGTLTASFLLNSGAAYAPPLMGDNYMFPELTPGGTAQAAASTMDPANPGAAASGATSQPLSAFAGAGRSLQPVLPDAAPLGVAEGAGNLGAPLQPLPAACCQGAGTTYCLPPSNASGSTAAGVTAAAAAAYATDHLPRLQGGGAADSAMTQAFRSGPQTPAASGARVLGFESVGGTALHTTSTAAARNAAEALPSFLAPQGADNLAALASLAQSQPRSTSRASIGGGNKHARSLLSYHFPTLPAEVEAAIEANTGNNIMISEAAHVLGQACIYAQVSPDDIREVLRILVNASHSNPHINLTQVANSVTHRVGRDGEQDVVAALSEELLEAAEAYASKSRRITPAPRMTPPPALQAPPLQIAPLAAAIRGGGLPYLGAAPPPPPPLAQPGISSNLGNPPRAGFTVADLIAMTQSGQLASLMAMVEKGQLNPSAQLRSVIPPPTPSIATVPTPIATVQTPNRTLHLPQAANALAAGAGGPSWLGGSASSPGPTALTFPAAANALTAPITLTFPASDGTTSIAAGRTALLQLPVPVFFTMPVPERAAHLVTIKLTPEHWVDLLQGAAATKAALKTAFTLDDYADKVQVITTDGLTQWLEVRPALQHDAAKVLIHNTLRTGNVGPAFLDLRKHLLSVLVATKLQNVTDVARTAITTLNGQLCIDPEKAAGDICTIFNRLDQSFIPQFIPQARKAWDDITFQFGVHSIYSYLDSLLFQVGKHFQDESVHDVEVRNKFKADMHVMATSADSRFAHVRPFYDYTFLKWSGTMAALLESLENSTTTKTVIPTKKGATFSAATRGEGGGGGGMDMGDLAKAIQGIRSDIAAAQTSSAGQLADVAKVFALALGESPQAAADAGAGSGASNDKLIEAYTAALAKAHGAGGYTRTDIVVAKKLPLPEIITKGLLPTGMTVSDLHPGVLVGKDCAFCVKLRKEPWKTEWESAKAYMEHHKCQNPLHRHDPSSDLPQRKLEADEVIKHPEEECFRARLYYSQQYAKDKARYAFLLAAPPSPGGGGGQ